MIGNSTKNSKILKNYCIDTTQVLENKQQNTVLIENIFFISWSKDIKLLFLTNSHYRCLWTWNFAFVSLLTSLQYIALLSNFWCNVCMFDVPVIFTYRTRYLMLFHHLVTLPSIFDKWDKWNNNRMRCNHRGRKNFVTKLVSMGLTVHVLIPKCDYVMFQHHITLSSYHLSLMIE